MKAKKLRVKAQEVREERSQMATEGGSGNIGKELGMQGSEEDAEMDLFEHIAEEELFATICYHNSAVWYSRLFNVF